jgi:hypothetical protein
MSPRWNWDSNPPLAASECALLPRPKGGGAHSPAAKGVGESQFQRLEKRLALCLLCALYYKERRKTKREGWGVAFAVVLADQVGEVRSQFKEKAYKPTVHLHSHAPSIRSQTVNQFALISFRKIQFLPPCSRDLLRLYDMNGRSQMQGGKNWILPKEIHANLFFSVHVLPSYVKLVDVKNSL